MKERIQALLDHLNHGLVEREAATRLALLTVLAGENIVLIGPPGTGKSLIARRLAQSLGSAENGGYFEYLLTKFSTPDEIFGPLSISELKADRFRRNTAGYLPSVELAFLDEVFKASSSILNALLTILNERIYHNGIEARPVSLRALIAASNELPTGQEELAALYDRFLLRCFVDYVAAASLPKLLAAAAMDGAAAPAAAITRDDVQHLQQAARAVPLPPTVQQALQQIWQAHREAFKEDRREQLSDRRLMKCLHLLRISALTNGRDAVDLSDVLLLQDCLWNHPDNLPKVRDMVLSVLRRHSRPVPAQPALLPADDGAATGKPPQESAADGIPLAPAQASASGATGEKDAVVKGFCGRGTVDDPLLVQSADHLLDLGRPEVGLHGYHFRQTGNIDCSSHTSWTRLEFKGCFDGGKFSIKGPPQKSHPLFSTIRSGSIVRNARLIDLRLAERAERSEIHHCASTLGLVEVLTSSHVHSCHSGQSLCKTADDCTIGYCSSTLMIVSQKAMKCKFNSCQAGDSFIGGDAEKCEIQDCRVKLTADGRYGFFRGATKDCSIEKCFVFGKNNGSGLEGGNGFAATLNGGHLINSMVGAIRPGRFSKRICGQKSESARLENNYSIDSNPITTDNENDKGGLQGESVATARFNQRFFEYTLGWNFDTVWCWVDKENQPALRHAGADAQPPRLNAALPSAAALQDGVTEDLLTRQVKANIWL